MSLAYLDAFSGIAGDMMVGALLDCGLDIAALESELSRLPLEGYAIRRETRERSGIHATKFVVDLAGGHAHTHPHEHAHGEAHGGHGHQRFRDIRAMIRESSLQPRVCELALQVFARLAEAEGKVHGVEPEDVAFHEVGAIDSIVDIVGTAWAIDALGIDDLVVSALPLGRGIVRAAHGPLPVPGPATIELLRGFPVRVEDGEWEMVTPTGAAIVAALARPGPMPAGFVVDKIGYGAGDSEFTDRPNLLRVLLGKASAAVGSDLLVLLESNIDDLNPELYEHATTRLFAAGAVDVTLVPVQMKKGRPGVVLQVLAPPARRDDVVAVLFAETTTIGVRFHAVERLTLAREFAEVETAYGPVAVKIATGPGGRTVAPEYESCRAAAVRHGVPLRRVYDAARRAAE